jgi:hypothetical protein
VHHRPAATERDGTDIQAIPWSRLTDGARTWEAGAGTPDSTVSLELRGSRDTVFNNSVRSDERKPGAAPNA